MSCDITLLSDQTLVPLSHCYFNQLKWIKNNCWSPMWNTHNWLMSGAIQSMIFLRVFSLFQISIFFSAIVSYLMNIRLNKQYQEVKACKSFWLSELCIWPLLLVFTPHSHHFKWAAVNDFVPGSHYAGSSDMHSLSMKTIRLINGWTYFLLPSILAVRLLCPFSAQWTDSFSPSRQASSPPPPPSSE